ncbi:putative transmembrane reductase CYB561D1 isoform X2 [Genypterus blacodes]
MREDVEYSPVGEGLGMRDYWLYAWMRRAAVIAAHMTGLSLTLIISVLSRPGTSLFSWHPMCMSIAYCLCMTEGILLFSPEGSPFCIKSRKGKVRLHWFCQALVLVTATTGLSFMVASKNVSERPHMVSWHSMLGVCTLCVTALQAAFGVCLIFPKLLPVSSSSSLPPRLKLYHATCGLLVYLLATLTVVLAMFSDWFQATVKGVAWWAFLLLPLYPALVVMNQVTNAYLPRKKITS